MLLYRSYCRIQFKKFKGLSSENTSWSSSTDSSSSDSPNQMCKQISFSSPRRTKRCIWNDEMDTCLLLYLELNKDKMEKLHNPHSGVKSELWNGASKWMLADGHDLSPKQCFNRWKNIKQCYKCGKLNEVKDPVQYNSKTVLRFLRNISDVANVEKSVVLVAYATTARDFRRKIMSGKHVNIACC
ncbi:hypothetical protein RhiirA4_472686 [Rhizophagus irregularis]|uniref:Myb/SANT-like DNA-binding domain-containing protein n=1 Tax=Rhizophagus irregularis TaxID=588596 RepID=A0A2I1H5B0_9GLOM|nr:hypothetical protein RhiirA4_472686 [Rhizophagus irregularis]